MTNSGEELDSVVKLIFMEEQDTKMVFCIHGQKGQGKTAVALGYPGKNYVLSFDRKTQRIKQYMYESSGDIVVIDVIRFLIFLN